MPKKEQPRPSISNPFGPVKHSQGPDLARSDRFTVVDGIKDCVDKAAADASDATASAAAKTTRRLSASFSKDVGPAASPTVASSPANATTTAAQAPPAHSSSKFLRKASFPSFGRAKSSKTLLPTSSTAAALPGQAPNQGQNMGASASSNKPVVEAPQPPRQASKLPKSRTMNVLHDLKNSISRQNLSAIFNDARRGPTASQTTASSRTSAQLPGPPGPPSQSQVPGPQQAPGPSRDSASSQGPAIARKPVPVRSPGPSRTVMPPQVPGSSQMPPPPLPSRAPPAPPQKNLSPIKARETQVNAAGVQSKRHSVSSAAQPVTSGTPSKRHSVASMARSGASGTPSVRHSVSSVAQSGAPNAYGTPSQHRSVSSVAQSSRSATPEPARAQIIRAEPMEYWTGRFSRLNDIYMAEDSAPEMLLALRSGLISQSRSQVNTHNINEEDARHMLIFAQLDFLCATQEARQSLREFQQTFARRFNRPILLPEGGSMEGRDRGLVSRFFGNRRTSGEPRSSSGQGGAPDAGSDAGTPRAGP